MELKEDKGGRAKMWNLRRKIGFWRNELIVRHPREATKSKITCIDDDEDEPRLTQLSYYSLILATFFS